MLFLCFAVDAGIPPSSLKTANLLVGCPRKIRGRSILGELVLMAVSRLPTRYVTSGMTGRDKMRYTGTWACACKNVQVTMIIPAFQIHVADSAETTCEPNPTSQFIPNENRWHGGQFKESTSIDNNNVAIMWRG